MGALICFLVKLSISFCLLPSRPGMGGGIESRSATEPQGGVGFKSNSATKTQGSWLVKLPIDYSFV